MTVQRYNYDVLDEPVGPFVHAVSHQGVLYTSGLTAFGTPAQTGNIGDQARAIFHQLQSIAQRHDSSLQQLIKVTIFVTDFSHIASLRDTLFEMYGKYLPASALVKVDSLFAPELLIEVEGILAV